MFVEFQTESGVYLRSEELAQRSSDSILLFEEDRGEWGFVQSSKNAADRAYIENVPLNNYGYPQRTFYMSLFMSAGGNQFEHSRMGYSGGLRNFYGIFMFDNVHF